MTKKQKFIIKMAVTAMLIAVATILNRVGAITTPDLKIGFSFIPIMVCGMMFGPVWGGLCGGLADLLAAILMPIGIPHLGITFTAFLSGVIYGILGVVFSKLKNPFAFSAVAAALVVLEKLLCTLALNSLWISQLSGAPYLSQMAVRIPQAVILSVPEIVLAILVKLFVLPKIEKFMK